MLLAVVLNLDGISKDVSKLLSVMSPIFVGLAMAFILNIIMSGWEKVLYKKKAKNTGQRAIALLLSFITVFLIFYLASRLVIPQISESINEFVNRFPDLYIKVREFLLRHSDSLPYIKNKVMQSDIDGQTAVIKITKSLTSWSANFFAILNTLFGLITNIIMGIILSVYLVFDKDTLLGQFDKLFKKIIPEKILRKIYYVLDIANDTFKAFFTGQFIEAFIIGILCTVGMFIFSFPFAAMIGSFVALTSLIPMLGAYIGGAFGFLMIATQSFPKAVLFVVFLIVLQQLEGNLIYPRVVGKSVGLPGVWILISIIVSGGLFGILGIIIGVPLTATVYKLLKNFANS